MEKARGPDGRQQANNQTFPGGWPAVTSAIHALGMKSGLYTSKSLYTCAGFNASCGKETIDAQAYADWGIDYVGSCLCVLGCAGGLLFAPWWWR